MSDNKRILVTAALPYANGPLHLGHLAGAYLTPDFYTRYKRLRGDDIVFICGSDEHGVPITIAAEKEGVKPQDIVDRFHEMNKKVFEEFGISFDYYGRTSSKTHHETAQEFFTNLNDKGYFKKKTEKQLYDSKADMFLPDRYVKGTCPNCSYTEAYGDQCEKCGTSLSPTELIDPVSALTGEKPELKETEHWYMPLGETQEKLEKWLDTRKNWKPNVMGQVKSWLNDGLADRAATRDLSWGVPVPLKNAKGKVLYVWFDAPIGYISATKEWAEQKGTPEAWKDYWQDENSELYHFIGKDNIVFHCIMFPTILMEHGGYVLPENVPANEFLNLEGKKLSTSRGWAVWLHEYLEDFSPDLLRYALGTTLPESKDSDFSWKDFQARVNNELAAVLGNFVFRALSFTQKFADGEVPELVDPKQIDLDALKSIEIQKEKVTQAFETFKFKEAISEMMNLARAGNKYFTETEPWKTRNNDPQACANSLHVSLQICAALSVLMEPVLPDSMKKLRNQLSYSGKVSWDSISDSMLEVGNSIDPGEVLFTKVEDEEIEAQVARLEERAAANDPTSKFTPLKENIGFEDFMKLDIRAGEILEAEKIEKSDKLLKLKVDIGIEIRTIVSGIAKHVDMDKIVGQKVSVVANLAPKKLMGVESAGMILMAEDSEGNLKFVDTEAESGSTIT
ncbi:MAG: methionine--tRNA ligase [Balneola sp.]|nr:methionine--tRNA ligase [Balneola sp.]MBO6651197.1 methionine--tRNA ligase [Balneola sp.]MBO6710386.1 methionine--tRNA ligase [Balneola sp.]MBO6799071.1 methionine--tRNA ligase [Balneola sp.]MBO6870911.1 methionine--tRNA ligase [Balneola sp.]